MKMTIDDLRHILFQVNEEEISVKELKYKLFPMINCNKEITNYMNFGKIFTKNNI